MIMYNTKNMIYILSKLIIKIYEENPDQIGIALNKTDIVIYGYKDNCYIRLI